MAADKVFRTMSWEIFAMLPAKTIFKFTSVSKSCEDLPSNYMFKKQQSRNMIQSDELSFFLQLSSWEGEPNFATHHMLSIDHPKVAGVPTESLEFLRNNARILASSGGLLFCKNISKRRKSIYNDAFFICNPATRTLTPIPAPDKDKEAWENSRDYTVIFECDTNCDFTLMVIANEDLEEDGKLSKKFKSMIYSFETREWKYMGRQLDFGLRQILGNYVFREKVVHFLSSFDCTIYTQDNPMYFPYILAYDIIKGTTSFLKIPKGARRGRNHRTCRMDIFKWGKTDVCIVKIRKGLISVWVTKNYEKNSWTLILKKRAIDMGILTDGSFNVWNFTVVNGDTLLITVEKKIYRYYLKKDDDKAEMICKFDEGQYLWMRIYPYSNSLMPCLSNKINPNNNIRVSCLSTNKNPNSRKRPRPCEDSEDSKCMIFSY